LGTDTPDLLVCDTGGTTFDVGLISGGEIHYSADTWLGGKWTGHITGTKAVDVRSVGAGGGSLVSVDSGGLLRVGPESAGADPGPACYARGGTMPTVTDAAAILGFLDPDRFLDGRLTLDVEASRRSFAAVAERLGMSIEEVAQGTLVIATQNVVSAIREITIAQGIDPRDLAIVAGGGAGGLNVVQMARELGCRTVLVPRTAGALSAAGALGADVISEFAANGYTESGAMDFAAANAALDAARGHAEAFLADLAGLGATSAELEASVDARYRGQVWELETPLVATSLRSDEDVEVLEQAFHAIHERVFAVSEPGQHVECITWRVRAVAKLPTRLPEQVAAADGNAEADRRRRVVFAEAGARETPIYDGDRLAPGTAIDGPAVILEPTSTLVIDPGAHVRVSEHGTYVIDTEGAGAGAAVLSGEASVR
jgi:N-methylhydantoinase A